MVGKPFNRLKNSLAVLIDLLPQKKPGTLQKVESIAAQIQPLNLVSDKVVEFIGLNKESGLCLGLNHRYPLSSLSKPAEKFFYATS